MERCYFCNGPASIRTADGEFICNGCLVKNKEELRIFISSTVIPNYFPREYLEEYVPEVRNLSDREIFLIVSEIEEALMDDVSEMFFEYLRANEEEYRRRAKELLLLNGEMLKIRVGKYEVVAVGNENYLELYAERDGRRRSIVNLNYVLSNVIEPAIEDWESRREIWEGECIRGTRGEIASVLANLKELEGDEHFERALDEDFGKEEV